MTTSDWLQGYGAPEYPELNCTVATVTETAETCVPTFTRVSIVQMCLRFDLLAFLQSSIFRDKKTPLRIFLI